MQLYAGASNYHAKQKCTFLQIVHDKLNYKKQLFVDNIFIKYSSCLF